MEIDKIRRRTASAPTAVDAIRWAQKHNETTPDEVLIPGNSAKAVLLARGVKPAHNLEIEVFDPFFTHFVMPAEKFLVRYDSEQYRYETVGKHGLRRKGVVTESMGIAAGSHGEVTIYWAGAATGITVDAWLDWMHGGQDLANGLEVIVEYWADESSAVEPHWSIVSAECS